MNDNNYKQYDEGYLSVGDGHDIYYAQHGNPNGVPLLLVHGGPGGRSYESNADIADLDVYRVIRYDQRGTGYSKYVDQMAGQTIANQVQDIEMLRRHLGVDQWVIAGGSFGATLSSYYRIAYPENVAAQYLRAMFYGDKAGAKHIAEGGGYGGAYARHVGTAAETPLVEAWQDYANYPEQIDSRLKGTDLISAYMQLMSHENPEVVKEAGLRFDRMDTSIVTATPSEALIASLDDKPQDSINLTRMFFHYSQNEYTYHGQQNIIVGLASTSNIPTVLVHGKRDYICPVRNAETLAGACPEVDVRLIDNAGHSMADEPLKEAMVTALKECHLVR